MSAVRGFLEQGLVQQLGWTLIQFFWQGTMIAVLFASVRGLLGRAGTAQSRYALACGALGLMVAAPGLTFVMRPNVPPLTAWPLASHGAWSEVLPWLVATWLIGVVAFSIRLIGGWRVAARLRSVSVHRPESEWQQRFKDLIERVGVSRSVQLLVSSLVEVPTVVGWLRPVILMPVGALTGLPPGHVEALLAHELAHVRRLDYLVNILQSIAETVLFYHPAVWWVSDQIRAEREICCDDLAVAASGDVLTYARALAELESCRPLGSRQAMTATGGSLMNRIRRLIGQAPPASHALPGPGAAGLMSMLCLLGVGAMVVNGAPVKALAPAYATRPPLAVEQIPSNPYPILSTLLFGPVGPAQIPQPSSMQLPGDVQNKFARIEGKVVRAGSSEPIDGAQVIRLLLPGDPRPPVAPGARPALPTPVSVDAAGRFTISDLDAGTYGIQVSAPGFVPHVFGPASPGRTSSPVIQLNAGETKTVNVAMTAMGNISGRILDKDRRPLVGVGIQVLQPVYNGVGQRTLRLAGEDRTDDRGDYRVHWIVPGNYYILAGFKTPTPSDRLLAGNLVPGQGVAWTYFPNASEPSQATLVELKSGADIGGMDFVLERLQAHTVRGSIVDRATGKPPAAANVGLETIWPSNGRGWSSGPRNFNPADGTFELRDVSPGPHSVYVEMTDPEAPPVAFVTPVSPTAGGIAGGGGGTSAALGRVVATAHVPVNVADFDIDGVVVNIGIPPPIRGRLTVDGQPSSPGFERMRVQLWPWVNGAIAANVAGAPSAVMVLADGSFTLEGVSAGRYRVTVSAADPNAYIKEARFGSAEALDRPLTVAERESSMLSVVLSLRAAQIDGTLADDKLQPVSGIQAVLIPDLHRDRPDLYRSVSTDTAGHFHMQSIPPGDYKLFAWSSIEPNSWFDPNVVRRYERMGQPLKLLESGRSVVQVKVIP